jgi:uncharacterized protein (DUF433 family)
MRLFSATEAWIAWHTFSSYNFVAACGVLLMKAKRIGRYLCADPRVCHGQLTFRGTRILVGDILELVADGMNWDDIIQECHESIPRAAIAEAIRVAGRAVVELASA